MKQYAVDVNFTVAKRIYVDAENEGEAERIVDAQCKENPYEYCMQCDDCVDHEILEVFEDEEEDPTDIIKGLRYVRKQLNEDELLILKAKVSRNLESRQLASTGIDTSKVTDLLEEYGRDSGLPEDWWMETFSDIDDLLTDL